MQHTIRKQVLDVSFGQRVDKFRTQQLVSDYYKDTILPALERSFDKFSDQQETVYLDQLNIDLGLLELKKIESRSNKTELADFILEHCHRLIGQAQSGFIEKKPAVQNVFEQWLFFLERGYLPWNVHGSLDSILKQVKPQLNNETQNLQLRKFMQQKPVALNRLIYQHRDGFLLDLIRNMLPNEADQITQMIQGYRWFMQQLSRIDRGIYIRDKDATRHQIWRQLLLKGIHQKPPVMDELIKIIVSKGTRSLTLPVLSRINGISEKELPGILIRMKEIVEEGSYDEQEVFEDKKRTTEDSVRKSPDEEGIFVQHAGLVLLHPFLKAFFLELGLLKGDNFRNEKARQKALYILHYLATGKEDPDEDVLVIPKLLCNFPLEGVLTLKYKLKSTEKKKADELLRTIIAQWTVLKNTSSSTLRQQFLQRNGKLFSRDNKVYLQVETNSIDVLLDRLPWSLSIVKLPWKKDLLWVEWR